MSRRYSKLGGDAEDKFERRVAIVGGIFAAVFIGAVWFFAVPAAAMGLFAFGHAVIPEIPAISYFQAVFGAVVLAVVAGVIALFGKGVG